MEAGSSRNQSSLVLERNTRRYNGGSLMGRLETTKDLNRASVISMIQKDWQLKEEVEVLDMDGNTFVFQFANGADYMKVLCGRPWAIQSHLLNLQEWEDDMVYNEVCFKFCPIWIQVHGLPLAYLNQSNACTIGATVGEVVIVEDPIKQGTVQRKFLRARVLLDISKPLLTGLWVARYGKEDVWAEVRYERLPSHCLRCGRIRHEQRSCSVTKESTDDDSVFGPHLRANPPRSMDELLCLVKEGWCEWQRQGDADEASEKAVTAPLLSFISSATVPSASVSVDLGRSSTSSNNNQVKSASSIFGSPSNQAPKHVTYSVSCNNSVSQPEQRVDTPMQFPTFPSGITSGKVANLDASPTDEDEIEEEAPEMSNPAELNLRSFGDFGISAIPNQSTAKQNPFGSPFSSAGASPPTPPMAFLVSSGGLYQPASFTLPEPEASEKRNPSSAGSIAQSTNNVTYCVSCTNSVSQPEQRVDAPMQFPTFPSGITSGKVANLDATPTDEDEMEEEAPEMSNLVELILESFDDFGISAVPSQSTAKQNPFGGPFSSAGASPPTPPMAFSVPSGGLFQPASFTLPSSQPSAVAQSTNSGAFSGGFGTVRPVSAAPQSEFGQPAQVGSGQQALGSVLGSFGQSRQLGGVLPGSGFGGGFGVNGSAGGFSSASTSAGGFTGMGSTSGGFAAIASSGVVRPVSATPQSGFGQPAQVGSGQQALGSVLGSFGQLRQLGGGLPGSGFGGGFGVNGSAGGFSSGSTSAGGFAGMGSTSGGFAAVASSGVGFSGVASFGGFARYAAASGGGFAAASTGGFGGGFAGAAPGGGFGGGFGNQGSGFGAGGGTNKPPELFTQMRK